MSKLTRHDIDQLLKSVDGTWVHTASGSPYDVFVPSHEALIDLVLLIANHGDDLERSLRKLRSWSALSEELLEKPGEQR